MEEKSLAFEMLQELQRSSKRWFIIAMVELFIIVGIIVSYFVYESQFEYEVADTTTQEVEQTDLNNSTISQNIGE